MGDLLTPLFLAGCGLLVLAGAPKVADPKPLVRAVRTAGLPLGATAVRLFAGAEVLAGVAGLVVPGRLTGLLVALLYGLFTAFVARALRQGGVLESCGCFGRSDTPPTRSHLGVTALLAVTGLALLLAPPATRWWAVGAGAAVATLASASLLALLAWAVMAVLPTVTAAAVRSTGTAEPGGRTSNAPETPRRGKTFAIDRRGPAPLPYPTFPTAQKG